MKNKKRVVSSVFFALGFLVGFTSLAQAQATRTWVSGVGDDAYPCSRTSPCKTFAGAISKTAAGGEINVIDSGGFGGVTITKSITINVEPFLGSVLVSGTNGIVINDTGANAIVVTLRGLELEGSSLTRGAPGLIGVKIISAKSVSIENCVIRNFSSIGVSDERTGGGSLFVTNSIIKNNTQSNLAITGISTPAISAHLDNVKLVGSTSGNGLLVSGGNAAVIRDSVIFGNGVNGLLANDANTDVSVENCVFNNNAAAVRTQTGTAVVRISGNTITKNGTSLRPGNSGGQIISYGNNNISGNATELPPTSTITRQ